MAEILYATTEQVTAYLGLDPDEAKDELLLNARLDLGLKMDLGSWLPTHATIWADGEASGADELQIKKMEVLYLYSQAFLGWSVARKKMLLIKVHSDGKAQMNRFDIDPDGLAEMALADMGKWKDLLLDLELRAQEIDNGVASILVVSSPVFDPIVGP